jgi:membrane protein implicated in regulation of membrane protease activity
MDTIFLALFLFGFLLVLASALLGFAHIALPGGEGVHLGHDGGGGPGGGMDGHGHVDAAGGGHGLPLWNVSTLLAFLMWFGAGGYVATRLGAPAPLALVPAVAAGVAGGLLVSAFLRLLRRGERVLNPRDFEMAGTLARVSIAIPAAGTGEIIFSKGDTRRGEGARSLDGTPIARGEEVVVVEYRRGIALVQRWQEFIADARTPVGDAAPRRDG